MQPGDLKVTRQSLVGGFSANAVFNLDNAHHIKVDIWLSTVYLIPTIKVALVVDGEQIFSDESMPPYFKVREHDFVVESLPALLIYEVSPVRRSAKVWVAGYPAINAHVQYL